MFLQKLSQNPKNSRIFHFKKISANTRKMKWNFLLHLKKHRNKLSEFLVALSDFNTLFNGPSIQMQGPLNVTAKICLLLSPPQFYKKKSNLNYGISFDLNSSLNLIFAKLEYIYVFILKKNLIKIRSTYLVIRKSSFKLEFYLQNWILNI